MVGSSLFRKIYLMVLILVVGYGVLLYLLSAPIVRTAALNSEQRAAESLLNEVRTIVSGQHRAIQADMESARAMERDWLRQVVAVQMGLLRHAFEQARKSGLDDKGVRAGFLEETRSLRYGDGNYFWIVDFSGNILVHPDPRWQGRNLLEVFTDPGAVRQAESFLRRAKDNPEGSYLDYAPPAPEGEAITHRLAFGRAFWPYEWILATGISLGSVEKEISAREAAMVADLKETLRGVLSRSSGQTFILDRNRTLVIHPDPRLEGRDLSHLVDPATGRPLVDEIMEAARTGKRAGYSWSHPRDPDHYAHPMAVWARTYDPLGWTIVTSTYMEDLNRTDRALRNRILYVAGLLLILAALAAYFLARRILDPMEALAEAAGKAEQGDLTVRVPVRGKDEMAGLGRSFNTMVERLARILDEMDDRVRKRTLEVNEKNESLKAEIERRTDMEKELTLANEKLTRWVNELERRNREIGLLNDLGDMLSASQTVRDAYQVVGEAARKLFPGESGGLFMAGTDPETGEEGMVPVSVWGPQGSLFRTFPPQACWAVRRGRAHLAAPGEEGVVCAHVQPPVTGKTLCVPLVAQGAMMGVVHLVFPESAAAMTANQKKRLEESRLRLAQAVAEHLSLTLANLKLRDKLRALSLRDPLTGLFNRRYMEEALTQELHQAERSGAPLGGIMMDVDHFKDFNDTHGHESGDRLLKALGTLLREGVRAGDIACRYGGEEFFIILPGAGKKATAQRAEAIRKTVEENLQIEADGRRLTVTLSAGVAAFPEDAAEGHALIQAADSALYRAKSLGRNRVEAFGPHNGEEPADSTPQNTPRKP